MNRGPHGPPGDGADETPFLADAAWLKASPTQTVLRVITDGGFAARIVGGAIRNGVLGRPVRDIDIATEATPEDVTRVAQDAGLKVVPTGLSHGTVTVIVEGHPFEVTTLREDVATFGRHAEVRFTDDWAGDARRRDFTMNALYCDADGRLYDPLGGLSDLQSQTVRFIGDPSERIREDYLRILRFFRFFSEYGTGDIDRDGLDACVRERAGIRRLSGERLRQELIKLLAAPRVLDALQSMFDFGLLGEFLPTVPHLNHLARLCGIDDGGDPVLRLAVLGVCVSEDAETLHHRLRLSNTEYQTLKRVEEALRVDRVPDAVAARRWLYRAGVKVYGDQVLIAWSRSYSELGKPEWAHTHTLPQRWTPPSFPVTGKTALELGAAPGPAVGRALRDVETLWLDSDFSLDDDALRAALAQRILADGG